MMPHTTTNHRSHLATCIYLLALLMGLSVTPASAFETVLHFTDGGQLKGDLLHWDQQSIRIKNTLCPQEIIIATADVTAIDIETPLPNEHPLHQSTELFTNHRTQHKNDDRDLIIGELADIQASHISLDTHFAGKLDIRREFITNLDIDPGAPQAINECSDFSTWQQDEGDDTWSSLGRSLICKNSNSKVYQNKITKDVKMPKRIRLSCEIEWKAMNGFCISTHYKDLNESQSRVAGYTKHNSYYFTLFSNGYLDVRLSKIINGRNKNDITAVTEQQMNANGLPNMQRQRTSIPRTGKYEVEIYADIDEGVFHVFIDKEKVASFRDNNPHPSTFASSLALFASKNSHVRINHLTIRPWYGPLIEDQFSTAIAELDGEGERIYLQNGDAIQGKIGSIKDRMLAIETTYGEMQIPVRNMRTIEVVPEQEIRKIPQPLSYAEDVRLQFRGEGNLIVKAIKFENGMLRAYHQAFGEKLIDLRAFKRIDLQIYDPNFIERHSTRKNW